MTIEPAGCREVKKLTIRNVFEQSAGGVKVIQDWPCKLSISTYRKRFLLVYIYKCIWKFYVDKPFDLGKPHCCEAAFSQIPFRLAPTARIRRHHHQPRPQRWGVRHVWTQFAKNIRRDMPSCGALFWIQLHEGTIYIDICICMPWRKTFHFFLRWIIADTGGSPVEDNDFAIYSIESLFIWKHFVGDARLLSEFIVFVIHDQEPLPEKTAEVGCSACLNPICKEYTKGYAILWCIVLDATTTKTQYKKIWIPWRKTFHFFLRWTTANTGGSPVVRIMISPSIRIPFFWKHFVGDARLLSEFIMFAIHDQDHPGPLPDTTSKVGCSTWLISITTGVNAIFWCDCWSQL